MNRNQRRGAMGAQGGIFLSKSGTESIIPLDTPMEEHVLISKTLQHPFRAPPLIPRGPEVRGVHRRVPAHGPPLAPGPVEVHRGTRI